jgi:hypothetical protein
MPDRRSQDQHDRDRATDDAKDGANDDGHPAANRRMVRLVNSSP